MALGDLFGGKKPQRRAAGQFERQLVSHAEGLTARRGTLSNAVNLYMDDLQSGRTAARSDALGAAAADVSQALPSRAANPNQALDNALTRARGLSRVVGATAREFDSQLLRDRIAAVRMGRARQGQGVSLLGQAASLEEGVNAATAARRRSDRAVRQNTLGALVGAGVGVAANRGELFGGRGGGVKSPSKNKPTKIVGVV